MNKVIYRSTRLHCDIHQVFKMFTVNKHLKSWLTKHAEVEPRIGGKYELFWDPDDKENNSTIGCKITTIEKNKVLGFEWKGPPQFKHFMNTAVPLTHVIVFFMPCSQVEPSPCTEVHLIHSGWGDSAEWQEAKVWFDKAWFNALKNLKEKLASNT